MYKINNIYLERLKIIAQKQFFILLRLKRSNSLPVAFISLLMSKSIEKHILSPTKQRYCACVLDDLQETQNDLRTEMALNDSEQTTKMEHRLPSTDNNDTSTSLDDTVCTASNFRTNIALEGRFVNKNKRLSHSQVSNILQGVERSNFGAVFNQHKIK